MIAIEALDMARHEFERGDRRAILSGLNLCAANNIPIPRWLADAFAETVRDVKAFKYSSWDAALGSPHRGAKGGKRGAGPKIAARRAYKELEIPAVLKVLELDAKGVKTTDDVIFKQAAGELRTTASSKKTSRITASTVKRIYYGGNRQAVESLINVAKMLKQLASDAEARTWVEAHFKGHPYGELAADLILDFSGIPKIKNKTTAAD